MVTPTDQQGEYSAICLFEGWKIEGRDLQQLTHLRDYKYHSLRKCDTQH